MLGLEYIISLYAPHRCLGCGTEGASLLCADCTVLLSVVPSRCYACKCISNSFKTCKRCRKSSPLSHVYVAAHYDEEVVRKLLYVTKYERARPGIDSMVERMAPLLGSVPPEALLVPVPTASSRVRQRGYDQAVLLAKGLSRRTGKQSVRLLARMGQAHQVGAGRMQRLQHLQGAFRPVQLRHIPGAHIVLVDDVLTTGATLVAAARILKEAGAAEVDAVVFAQPS